MENRLNERSRAHSRAVPNMTDRITQILTDELTGGRYKLGEILPPEQVIAERLGVSRTVLREAVSRLKVEGLVESKQGRGLEVIAVRRPTVLRMQPAEEGNIEQIVSIVELRKGFEVEAAALAALRREEGDLLAMQWALDDMERVIASADAGADTAADIRAGVDADMRFHQAVAEATRNEHYVDLFNFLSQLMARNLQVSRSRSARIRRSTDAQREHRKLFESIERGDPEMARVHARNHIENTEARLRGITPATRERTWQRTGALDG